MTELLPESITWGLLLTLAVRALPAIIENASKALAQRAEAKRLEADTGLVAAKRDAKRDDDLAASRAHVDELRAELQDAIDRATACIHAAEVDHATTRGRLDACEADLKKCTDEHESTKHKMTAMAGELLAIRKEMIR